MNDEDYAEFLRVGIVQTTVDNIAAWGSSLQMSKVEEERAIAEIQRHLSALGREDPPALLEDAERVAEPEVERAGAELGRQVGGRGDADLAGLEGVPDVAVGQDLAEPGLGWSGERAYTAR